MKEVSLIRQICVSVLDGLKVAFPDRPSSDVDVVKAKDPSFGDYQCNSAMKLAKSLKMAPREVASAIVNAMLASPVATTMLSRIEVAGPGFINMWLKAEYVAGWIQAEVTTQEVVRKEPVKEKVIVDFSSPNIAKEMHVGHLRSTIIGDCLSRVFEVLGYSVLRLNHVGDWGTAFGMLIAHIKSVPGYSFEDIAGYSLSDLMRLYRESKSRFDADELFRKQAQLEVVRIQGGDEESLSIWKTICDISERAYQEIYELLDVSIEVRGESYYNRMLPGIVEELTAKGLITLSDGAKCVFLEGFTNREGNQLPLMLQKSDGGYNYDTTDMAAIAQRIREERADRIIYVTDSGQATHFQMIFAAAKKAGILDPNRVRVDHVPFGLVLGLDGKKFRTRSGETERLIDLLQAAIAHADALLRERNPGWSEEEYQETARILGIGAVKYADLSSHRMSDYVFSYDRMLRFEGNTAAFIMYSYVRTVSIQRKIGRERANIETLRLEHPAELLLATTICQFQEVLEEVSDSLLPNRLTDYLYTLAETFNVFFRDCRVENDPRQENRLALVQVTGLVLKKGLELLGIKVPAKM